MFFNVRIAPVFRIKTRRGVMWKLLLPSYVYSWKLCARTTMSKGSENIRCCGKMCTSRLDLNSSIFKIQGFKYTYNNEYIIRICLYNFSFLKEMAIIRALDQSILDKRQMNKGWKITYVLRVVNAMIHRIWISHRPIVGRKYSAIFGLFKYGYVVKPNYLV